MKNISSKEIIEAVKAAYSRERVTAIFRGQAFLDSLEKARDGLIAILDNSLYYGSGACRKFNCAVAASLLNSRCWEHDEVGGPFFSLSRYAFSSLVEDLVTASALASNSRRVHFNAGRILITTTVEILVETFGSDLVPEIMSRPKFDEL